MCQLFISKDFETSLLTLFGVSLVLWRRERLITSIATPVLLPLAPKFSTSAFPIYSCFTFKNFLWEVVAIGSYGFANSCILFVPFLHCHAHPWERGGWGGDFCWDGRGNRKHEMMMIGDDDEMINFYTLYTKAFWELEGNTHCFLLCFCFLDFALLLAYFALKNKRAWKYLHPTFAPGEKCLRPMKNVCAQPSRLKSNISGLWKMFAPNLCA